MFDLLSTARGCADVDSLDDSAMILKDVSKNRRWYALSILKFGLATVI